MQLCPGFHESPLPRRQETGNQFDEVETENSDVMSHAVLIAQHGLLHFARAALGQRIHKIH